MWLMRQAGRYLPQYRAVRSTTTFLGLCKSPDLACEVTLQPIDEFGLDAAILFSDILIPLEAMGMRLEFTEEGPVFPQPLRDSASVDRLVVPDPELTMPFVTEAVRRIRHKLAGRVPLIGFAGAPFTLAAYAVEGGGSTQWTELKKLLFSQPRVAHSLLAKTSETIGKYLEAQVAAGAEAVQLFDTWAGILSSADFEEFALPYARSVVDHLRGSPAWREGGVPIIYFVNGSAPYLERMKASGADVIGLDWRLDIASARARLGDCVVQGNLDPACLFLARDQLEARVRGILTAGGGRGHIFNLGHGILPQTDVEQVRAMVAAVRRYGRAEG